jgi:release factor glutamine methyltransferase
VLSPRPETELLVEQVIKVIRKKKNLNILDVGTGSGAIIISLAKTFQHSQEYKNVYFGSDVSAKALEVAKQNAQEHGVKISFKKASLLKSLEHINADIITANLPYLAEKTISTKYEPKLALVARNRGLHLIQNLIVQIKNLEHRPLYVFLEIGYNQKSDIKKLAEKNLPGFKFQCLKDYAKRERLVLLSSPQAS